MAVFSRLLFAQIKSMMIGWVGATLFGVSGVMLLPYKTIPPEVLSEMKGVFIGIGFLLSITLAKLTFYQQRYFSVLKLTSKNLKTLWFYIISQNLLILSLAIAISIFVSRLTKASLVDSTTVWDCGGVIVIVFLYMFLVDGSQLSDRIQQRAAGQRGLIKTLLMLLVLFALIGFVILSYRSYSHLLALLGFSLPLVLSLFFASDEFVKTLPKRTRQISCGVSFVIVSGFLVVLGLGDLKYSREPNFIYSVPRPWEFSQIEKVQSIEEWIMWQNRLSSLDEVSVDQILQSYEKLTQYCPPKQRDNPFKIDCVGQPGYTDYQAAGKTVRTEEDVVKLLSAPNEYAQIMGIFYARKIKKPFSKELIVAVEKIADKAGAIQGIARNTLSESYPEDYRQSMRISTEKP